MKGDLIEIKVECHAGYKADEYPLRFFWDEHQFEVEEIIDRWYQGEQNSQFPEAVYFKVQTNDKKIFILRHEIFKDAWSLFIHGESLNL